MTLRCAVLHELVDSHSELELPHNQPIQRKLAYLELISWKLIKLLFGRSSVIQNVPSARRVV